jgi:exodeoxyribonuclease VII small subunit
MANTNENKLPEDLTFEQALDRLETIVKTLEGDSCSLEEALSRHAEGVALARFCEERLTSAEMKISNLTIGE